MRFHKAGQHALSIAANAVQELGMDVTVIRDLRGVVHVVVDDRGTNVADEALAPLEDELMKALGPYAPSSREECVLRATSFHNLAALVEGAVLRAPGVRWLERTAVPWDWRVAEQPPVDVEASGPRRLVFYGVKGGVGRSTAITVLAMRLAREGKRVLVVDLDLESPGIGPLLLDGALTEAGVVDWLVEDLVGNADEDLRRDLVQRASLEEAFAGEIWVAPAAGAVGQEAFIDKLARIYQPTMRDDVEISFAQRVSLLVDAIERDVDVDVTLIDSRAGIHELSATALTALNGDCLLFASDSAATWSGYDLLLRHWRQDRSTLKLIRERLHMVAALVPEAAREPYVASLREHAYQMFSGSVYDDQPTSDQEVFNFNVSDTLAPHYALEVHWARRLMEFNPRREGLPEEVEIAYRPLIAGLAERGLLP